MLWACGVTEFLLPAGRSATARIKQRPEDFVVVEVDPTGARTDAPGYRLPHTAAPRPTEPRPHNTPASSPSPSPPFAAATAAASDVAALLTAEDVLTDAVREGLLAQFGSKHDAVARYASGAVGRDAEGGAKQYFLGALSLKGERQRLHRALKHAFPHLRTETRRVPAPGGPAGALDCHVVATYDAGYLLLAHLLGEGPADAVEAWSSSAPRNDAFRIAVNFPQETTKESRRAFHEVVSRRYPGLVCRVANGQVTLKAALTRRREKRARDGVDGAASGLFTHLVVRKRSLDVMEMRLLLADYFGVPDTAVCTAGLKDKRGVTYQRCSVPLSSQPARSKPQGGEHVRLVWPSDPSSYVEILQRSEPCSAPVGVGELAGNCFSVRLVDVQGITFCELAQRLRQIESTGFLNYFGQQRFSERVQNTKDHVGVHLLAGRWAEAVSTLTSCVPGLYASFPERMEARHVPAGARDALCVVQALQRLHRTRHSSPATPLSADDVRLCTTRWQQLCHDALLAVPYNIRLLWVNAAQSLIFNIMLSKLQRTGAAAGAVGALPLPGHQVKVAEVLRPVFEQTLAELDVRAADVLEQRKVLGVPLPGAMRQTVARPTGCSLTLEGNDAADGFSATVEFMLPPSSYATIFLREALGCEQWW
ncbi:tRNA pseudouridine13 synthase [Trypanosoma conorhini]|uniref:tRNA pseudouridine13 synthase n=1 Tax=Trypanosoma conorhini TaxID=83891 RepID=A0A422QCA3_9TRYP|nr:tRNA pseudouridine13 synthase [Trypanosoma conorhini]RNF27569.1 tRNA pseudouridine13 synthase [Trypanosoma conorhini]